MKLPLQWRSFLALAALLVALLLVINLALYWFLPPYLRERIAADLQRSAFLARAALVNIPPEQLNAAAHRLQDETHLRVTVIARDGVVRAESGKAPQELSQIENHRLRPEVQDALERGVGRAIRRSDTVDVELMYVAVTDPATAEALVYRVALPLHEVRATIGHVSRTVAAASLVVVLLSIPIVYWLTHRLAQPIAQMSRVAGRVASGDFSGRAPVHLTGELGDLAAALNNMSAQLAARLRELGEEKAGLAATLAGMAEGVLVVDGAGKIKLMNATLRDQFQLADEAIGKTPLEALRHVGLDDLLAHPGARELTFHAPTERTFAVTAAALTGTAGEVVVFHDITRLKQLENLRKEFVANVSHELRTPVSVIRGYVETLLEEPAPDAATARQFLATIQKHSRQLEALIEDLLNISALESQQARVEFGPVAVGDVAAAAVEELAAQARAKNIVVSLQFPDDLPFARADRQRLRQVFVNLLGNAIQYTQAGGRVSVNAAPSPHGLEIWVADNGPGIAAEHLPRIFERFYRVDKARSRDLGGTGLGLSIVKHIVQAHGGKVWAESTVGQGSRFCFTLPLP